MWILLVVFMLSFAKKLNPFCRFGEIRYIFRTQLYWRNGNCIVTVELWSVFCWSILTSDSHSLPFLADCYWCKRDSARCQPNWWTTESRGDGRGCERTSGGWGGSSTRRCRKSRYHADVYDYACVYLSFVLVFSNVCSELCLFHAL